MRWRWVGLGVVALVVVAVVVALLASPRHETLSGTLPAPVPRPGTGRVVAGAAKADITPPPGYPMGGFSIVGRTARGWWTRLWARAVYLEDAAGAPLALVACDLWSVPGGLGDRVAELVAAHADGRHLARDALVLAATHTHHSPGNFSTSAVYNQYAAPRPGFDRVLFEFLARRIADAVLAAIAARRPADLAYGRLPVPLVARNRSFEAFALNPERDALLAENRELPVGPPGGEVPLPEAYRAVDPTLRVLVARDPATGAPFAVAAFYAVHATVMGPGSEVYSNDLFGVAATLAERGLGGDGDRLVAVFNGAEGDVSPAWVAQDRRNTLVLGERLANGIVDAVRLAATPLGDRIAGRFEPAVQLAGARVVDGHGATLRTPLDARMGASALGGAEDGRTVLWSLGWREGLRGPRVPGHGPKQSLLNPLGLEAPGWLAALAARLATPPPGPTTVPVGVYRLGPVALATLPGEFTTVLGRRIAAGVARAAGTDDVVLIGLANEYRSYFTTAEEYDAQHYEGGSTMYGPQSGAVVGHHLARLAGEPAVAPAARTYLYDAGAPRRYGVADVGAPPPRPDDGLADVLQDRDAGRPIRDAPCVTWDAPAVAWPPTGPTARVTPTVALERRTPDGPWAPLVVGGAPARDDGLEFVTVALDTAHGRTRWASFWLVPPDAPADVELRFTIDDAWASTTFRLRDGTARAPGCATVAAPPDPIG